MRSVLVLISMMFSFNAFSAEKPSVEANIDENNSIVVIVSNNDAVNLECHYTVSWLANVLTYKRYFGDFRLTTTESFEIKFKNDKYDRLSRVHVRVSCE